MSRTYLGSIIFHGLWNFALHRKLTFSDKTKLITSHLAIRSGWAAAASHANLFIHQFHFWLGTCKALRFDSNLNQTIPIRFESDGLLRNLPSYHKPCSLFNKKFQLLRHCNWYLFYVWFYVYVARAYTLASTVGAIVQYCLRKQYQENLHISVRL